MCESSIYINARPQGFPAEHRIITVIPLVLIQRHISLLLYMTFASLLTLVPCITTTCSTTLLSGELVEPLCA